LLHKWWLTTNFFLLMYMFGSVNDSHVLRKFGLYYCALHGGLFDTVASSQDRLSLYLLGDKGYPINFLVHAFTKGIWRTSFSLKFLYNTKHKKGRLEVKNAFGITKQIFKELL
jgi:hypothetical protein